MPGICFQRRIETYIWSFFPLKQWVCANEYLRSLIVDRENTIYSKHFIWQESKRTGLIRQQPKFLQNTSNDDKCYDKESKVQENAKSRYLEVSIPGNTENTRNYDEQETLVINIDNSSIPVVNDQF